MAIAGKVAITLSTENGGAWSASVTYDRLVAVTHNNNLYISRKTVANVEPPNDEYWFLALEGFGGDDVESILQAIENIINGTTQVGNAKTLDGHEAEYFAKAVDLLDYLKNTGGTVNGNLTVNTSEDTYRTINLKNATRALEFALYAGGDFRLLDATNNKNIIYSSADGTTTFNGTASGNLPLNGGTIRGLLDLKRSNDNVVGYGRIYQDNYTEKNFGLTLRDYADSENFVGVRICQADDKIYYRAKDNVEKVILHTGNKPTGSYTGNGDATSRTINTGGIGNVLYIWSENGNAIVMPTGGFVSSPSGGISRLASNEARFANGVLTLNTTNVVINASGTKTEYQTA